MTATIGGARLRVPRGAVIGAGITAALLLVALVGGPPGREGPPLDPRSDAPLGTSALVTLLEELGATVELSPGLPGADDDVALVLRDRLTEDQVGEILDWVRHGGTLVVADPGSAFTPPVAGSGLLPDTEPVDPGDCTIAALDAVGAVAAGAAVRYQVGPDDELCFGDREDGAFVVTRSEGAGELVAVGGAAVVTNELLDDADSAVLAAALLAPQPGTVVRFVDPPLPAGGGDKTLGDLVPAGVERMLAQLGVAFVLYALWRAIRHGQPVLEDQPVEIAGSELVAAVGRLLSQTREPGAAAEVLRGGLRRRLHARLGVPVDASTSALAELTAARLGRPLDEVLAAVDDRPVTTDAELVAVARAVASIHQEVPS